MAPLRSLTLLLVSLLAMLSGCIGDSGGSAKVAYDGTGNGIDDDETKCDDDGTLVASGQVDSGQVDVRVSDGDGRTLFTQTFDGGANLDTQGLEGASGTWRLSATRTSDTLLGSPFSGNYSFTLSC